MFRRHADCNFPGEFCRHPEQRYWEMYLTCTLIKRGFTVSCPKPGPDVRVTHEGRTIWIEAVAPTPGTPGSLDYVPDMLTGEVQRYPEREILLRFRNAIENKLTAYGRYVETGIVSPSDPFVVAVSGGELEIAFDLPVVPDIVKAVLPIGDQQIAVRLSDGESTAGDYTYRPDVQKSSGNLVRTEVFLDSSYAGISAILFSSSNLLNPPRTDGDEFILVVNPVATNPIPAGFLGFGREYTPVLEADSLSISTRDYRDAGSD